MRHTLIDAGVFTKWVEAGGGGKNCAELAELNKTDPALIKRLVRQISGQHLVIETAEDTYKPTPWVHALAADQILANVYGGLNHFVNILTFRTLPSYLKQTSYRNPTDPNNWSSMMLWKAIQSIKFTHWPEVYPTGALVANYKPDLPLAVNVGGSKGHDLVKFHICHPNTPARSSILQDLPIILRDLVIPDHISVKPHDFFTPQPVKGARAYFMHNVLHDWEDKEASQILKHIADTMEPSYSKLLIHESIIHTFKPLARVTTSDIAMVACLGANEW
ncbi:hypothetical protein FOFC_02405 [Fusarium oxysporum]|nr:hypothetical protein FOFC_02405 [Fusarium oxysporum]